jgi:ATP citrate (pro-S)-lyase
MSAKSILEADGKAILNYHLTRAPVIKPTPLPASSTHNPPPKLASLYFAADADIKGVLDQAEVTYPWLLAPGAKFVAKPDQLIKRRGKSGLLALNKPWSEARDWIQARAGKEQKVETVDGVLRQFLVEPFVPHPQDTEYYININSVREVRRFPFRPSYRFAVVRGVVSPEAVFGRTLCVLARIHLGAELLQKWERTAGSFHTGAPSGFV